MLRFHCEIGVHRSLTRGTALFVIDIIKRLQRDTRGATAIEYGLIAALIVIAIISAMQTFANSNTAMWDHVEEKYRNAGK